MQVKYERENQGLWLLFPARDKDKVTLEQKLEVGRNRLEGMRIGVTSLVLLL